MNSKIDSTTDNYNKFLKYLSERNNYEIGELIESIKPKKDMNIQNNNKNENKESPKHKIR